MSQASQAAAPDERQYLATVAGLVEQAWPAGVPREVRYPLGEIPVTEHLRHAARATPDKAGVVYYGYRLTYAQLDEASDRFAAFLEARGLVRGDRVAVLLYNCPQYFIVFYGILKLGCVHVPVNPMFKQHELRYQLVDADPRVLVTMDRLYPLVEAVRDETDLEAVVVTRFADYLPSAPSLPLPKLLQEPPRACPGALELPALLANHGPDFTRPAPSLDDLASINYTGGTTGMPKGCMHTQRNMLHACTAGRVVYLRPGASPRDVRTVSYVPSFWISGQLRLVDTVLTGSTLIYFARWDAEAVLQAIESVPGYPPQWTARHHRGADGTPGRRAARSELARSHLLHVVRQEAQPRLPAPLARVDRDYLARVVVRHDRDPHVGHVHDGNAGRRPGPEVHAHLRGAADSRHPVQDRRPR